MDIRVIKDVKNDQGDIRDIIYIKDISYVNDIKGFQ